MSIPAIIHPLPPGPSLHLFSQEPGRQDPRDTPENTQKTGNKPRPEPMPRPDHTRSASRHVRSPDDPYSPTAEADYERLTDRLNEFDILSLLRDELLKPKIHSPLTRRLIQALRFLDSGTRQQAVLSLLENIETLAPVIPQVMMAVRDCISDLDPEFIGIVHESIRKLIRDHHYVAQVDLNLAFMIRLLAGHRSTENELLLIELYKSAHGFGSSPAPYIQRDIMLILARWGITYWLSDQKNYITTSHEWVKRAFIIASYALGDEGRHWRSASMRSMRPFDHIVRDWVTDRLQSDSSWQVPI